MVAEFAGAFPDAAILVTAVSDPRLADAQAPVLSR